MKPVSILRAEPAALQATAAEPDVSANAETSGLGGVAMLAAVVALVGVVTVVQGVWTERWGQVDDNATLERDARILEKVFPRQFGDWEFDADFQADPKELERAGAVGHIARTFRNVRTKARVSAFVVCATGYHASGHTPDRCYPASGFEIAETEHRHTVPLPDGRQAEAWTGTFRKPGQTLRIFWTYGGDGRWLAPQIARTYLADRKSVYKLYAIIDETQIKSAQAMQECGDFLTALLPALDTAVAAAREAGETAPAEGSTNAAAAAGDAPASG
jgi:hypothetical protein